MNLPTYPRLAPSEVSYLDKVALELVNNGDVEWGWALRGIIDRCREGRTYDAPEEYRFKYDEGYTVDAATARKVLDLYANHDLYEARQALGVLVDAADDAREDF